MFWMTTLPSAGAIVWSRIAAKSSACQKASQGYVFLSDFDAEGSKDFVCQFYPERDKAGLIFDVRWNGGGFTSQAVLVLRRQRAGIFVNRKGAVSPLPGATAPKVMTMIITYGSASDGDQFPFFFHKLGLAPWWASEPGVACRASTALGGNGWFLHYDSKGLACIPRRPLGDRERGCGTRSKGPFSGGGSSVPRRHPAKRSCTKRPGTAHTR